MRSYRLFIANPPLRPAIVAHRGAWQEFSENSLASIQIATERAYDIVEIDVQKSADGILFLMHDHSLERMTGRDLDSRSLPIDELTSKRLRLAGGGKGAGWSHSTMPTLEAALREEKDHVFLDIDVKFPELMEDTAELILREGMAEQVDIKTDVQSRKDADELLRLQDQFGVMVMPKTKFDPDTADELIDILASIGARVVETKFDRIETIASRSRRFEAAGLTIWVNTLSAGAFYGFDDQITINHPDQVWGMLMKSGVGVIQTDEPQALAAYRTSPMAASS